MTVRLILIFYVLHGLSGCTRVPPKSPPLSENADFLSDLKNSEQRVRELEQQQALLLKQLQTKPALDTHAPATPPQAAIERTPNATDLLARSLLLSRLEAQIERDYNAYQSRPKRRFLGMHTNEDRFARYVEEWRAKVEHIGNLYYPFEARHKKLYGSLRLTVHIKADGSLEKIDIDRSSGSKILDDAALDILQQAAPFAPFPEEIRRDTDVLVISRTWTFTRSAHAVNE